MTAVTGLCSLNSEVFNERCSAKIVVASQEEMNKSFLLLNFYFKEEKGCPFKLRKLQKKKERKTYRNLSCDQLHLKMTRQTCSSHY